MSRTILLCVLFVSFRAKADDYRLKEEERQSEVAWLQSLGLKVPDPGPLLAEPFAEPFTQRSFLVPISWWKAPQPSELPANLLRQDVKLLRIIMERAYGGWERAATRGWDWNRWFADWDHALAGQGDSRLTLAQALAPFDRLERFQLDNHSGPVGGGLRLGSRSRTAVLQSAPVGVCGSLKMDSGETVELDAKDPAQLPKRGRIMRAGKEQMEDGFYVNYSARRGRATAIDCGGKSIALETWADSGRQSSIAALAGKPAGEPSYRTISEAIGYLRLPTFEKETDELLLQLLKSLPASAGHERLLIVDLRQNGGGDAPIESMERWVDLAPLEPVLKFNRRQPKSCVYNAVRWGYTQVSSQGLKPPLSDGLRNELQQQLDSLFQPTPKGCPVIVEQQHSSWDYRQHFASAKPSPHRPRLMLLTDSGCGSDCELMQYVLSAVPGSVVVGENTYGVCQFIQPGYFILPHTRLRFRIATGMSDNYGDGRSVDGYGLDPDIVLAGEQAHSPAAVLKLAQLLAP